jgi:citrate synthase
MTIELDLSTNIGSHSTHHIWVRDLDLTAEVMGERTFTEVAYLLIVGRLPSSDERRMLDAVLVSLMEHGLTPSAAVTRLTYAVAPEAVQGAVAAGLLGAGSVVLGSMEECGRLLSDIADEVATGVDRADAIEMVVHRYRDERRKLPGLGHVVHVDGDPRAVRLYELAEQLGFLGDHLVTMRDLAGAASARSGRALPINVTGAVAAVLLELDVPWQLHRGFALIARTAGLVAHVGEERSAPISPQLRRAMRDASSRPDASG